MARESARAYKSGTGGFIASSFFSDESCSCSLGQTSISKRLLIAIALPPGDLLTIYRIPADHVLPLSPSLWRNGHLFFKGSRAIAVIPFYHLSSSFYWTLIISFRSITDLRISATLMSGSLTELVVRIALAGTLQRRSIIIETVKF